MYLSLSGYLVMDVSENERYVAISFLILDYFSFDLRTRMNTLERERYIYKRLSKI